MDRNRSKRRGNGSGNGYKKMLGVFILGIVLVIALVVFFALSQIGNGRMTGLVIGDNSLSNIMIPSTVSSIVFSLAALATVLFLIYRIKGKGIEGTFPFKAYIASIVMVFVIYSINYFITFFPYGNISLIVIIFILQVIVYGILLPYIFIAQLCYITLLFKGEMKVIFK